MIVTLKYEHGLIMIIVMLLDIIVYLNLLVTQVPHDCYAVSYFLYLNLLVTQVPHDSWEFILPYWRVIMRISHIYKRPWQCLAACGNIGACA